MTIATDLIVLNTTKVGERSLVVHCLSREWGRRGFIVSASRASLFLPLSLVDAEVVSNPKSDLWRLQKASSRHILNGLRSSVAKNAIAMFISELLYRSIRDGEMTEGLFDFCVSSILTLDALEDNYANFHLRFLLEYAAALGFRPSIEDLAPFADDNYALIAQLLSSELGEGLLLPMSGVVRSQIADALIRYLSFHLEIGLNIRSLSVLGELFCK